MILTPAGVERPVANRRPDDRPDDLVPDQASRSLRAASSAK
jgi:hypothetical protein